MKLHLTIHSGEKPYKCGVCHKAYAEKYRLKLHSTKIHNEEIAYKVRSCEKKFGQMDDLNVPVKSNGSDSEALGIKKSAGAEFVPFIVKALGCIICNGLFQKEEEFMDHCYQVCYSPVDDDFAELF